MKTNELIETKVSQAKRTGMADNKPSSTNKSIWKSLTVTLLFMSMLLVAPRDLFAQTAVRVNGVDWSTRNVGEKGLFTSSPNEVGGYFTVYEAIDACPPGWRLPSKSEMQSLASRRYEWRRTARGAELNIQGDNGVLKFTPGGYLQKGSYDPAKLQKISETAVILLSEEISGRGFPLGLYSRPRNEGWENNHTHSMGEVQSSLPDCPYSKYNVRCVWIE